MREFCKHYGIWLTWIGLSCGSPSLAQQAPNASTPIVGVEIRIRGNNSAFLFREFRSIARKDDMRCSYKVRGDIFIDPIPILPPSLICGPKKTDLLIVSKNADPTSISIDANWFLESHCHGDSPYTDRALQVISNRLIFHLKTALAGNPEILEFAINTKDVTGGECPRMVN